MRKLTAFLAGLAFAGGCPTGPIPAHAATLSWRFAGLNAVRDNKDLLTWREVTGLPEFAGFNSNLVDRVSSSLAKALVKGGTNEAAISKLLTPISKDLVAYPTLYELNEEGSAHTWTLAIQIPVENHNAWRSNWEAISKTAKVEGAKLQREGDWTLLGNGPTKAILDKAKQPTTEILQIQGDALFLKRLVPNLKPTKSELHVTTRGKGLRSEGKAQFEQDLPFKMTPWQVPTNTIREPLVGFTAVQGVGDRLGKLDIFKNHPAPNQIFIWAEGVSFFSMYAAAKVDNARAFVKDVAASVNGSELSKKVVGSFEFDTNNYGLYITRLPIAVPFLRPAHSNDVNFVFAGTMPLAQFGATNMPAELVREVTSRTNLLYYDWELGWGRLSQIRPLSQLAAMSVGKPISNMADPANKWLSAAERKFGNTITEISKTGPRELSFVRSSDSGFSAVELFAFVQWVAGPPGSRPGDTAPGKAKPLPIPPPP